MKPENPDIWRPSFFAVSEALANIVARSEKYEEPEKSEKILVPWESIAEEEFRRA